MADLKTIGASGIVSVVAASVIVAVGGGKEPKELTLKTGATATDRAVSAVASLSKQIRPIQCTKHWGVAEGEQVFVWWCQGDSGESYMSPDVQTELDKAAANGVSYVQTPRQDGETLVYDLMISTGDAPPKPEIDTETAKLIGVK